MRGGSDPQSLYHLFDGDVAGFLLAHFKTLVIHELGFNQNYCTFTLILLINILVVNFLELRLSSVVDVLELRS